MALTPTEEAQTRALIAQEAQLLSLASEEPAIISNLGATDVSLSDLAAASSVSGTDLFLIRQGATDKSVTGTVLGVLDATDTVKGKVSLAVAANYPSASDTEAVTPAYAAQIQSRIKILDRAFAEYTANADITAVIPADDTIPQNTEGTQIISVGLTPKSATSRVRLRFQGEFSASANGVACAAALFSNASANALKASLSSAPSAGYAFAIACEHEYVPGSTTPITFSVRVGPMSAATIRLNGVTTQRYFGGAISATLIVEEIAP